MNYLIRNAMTALFALVFMSWSVGCCSDDETIKFRVDAQLNDSVRDNATNQYPAVTVDLVGVNPSEFAKWSDYSMTKYWEVENPYGAHRGDYCFQLSLGDGLAKSLPADDPIWERWKTQGVKYIFVMSSFPHTGEDHPGSADSRRNIIPIQCMRWDPKPPVVAVTIKSDGVTITPSPKPEVK